MNPRVLSLATLLLLPTISQAQNPPGAPSVPSTGTIQNVAARLRPSLVRIHVVMSATRGGREARSEAYGSGVILSKDGYIITNHHVAGTAKWISVTLSDNREVDAVLVGTDALSDLTVLKIPGGPYMPAVWGDDTKLNVGDPVMALGSPLAFSECVTAGVVSNTQLVITQGMGNAVTLDAADIGSIVRWIAHDAPIYSGNSGGALVNLRGELVGINEMEIGLSGAIPSSIARPVAEELIKTGHIKRAYTGLSLQPHPRDSEKGVLVAGVLPGSPAATAGIKPGDLILEASTPDGKTAFDVSFMEELPPVNLAISRWPVDGKVQLTVKRGKENREIEISPSKRLSNDFPDEEIPGWDLTAMPITPLTAVLAQLPNRDGLYVTGVAYGGTTASAVPPVEAGDVITKFNGLVLKEIQDLVKATNAIPKSSEGRSCLMELYRNGQRILSVVKINQLPRSDSSQEVKKSWLPISTQVLTPGLRQALKLPAGTQGIRVTRILDNPSGGKMANFPLKIGDVVIRLDDDEIEASSPEDEDVFETMVRQYRIGSIVKARVLRGGKPQVIPVKTLTAPTQERELPEFVETNFGVTIRSISYWDRVNKGAGPSGQGVLVTNIQDGSWAALGGLVPGNVLLAINGTPVKDLATAKAAFAALAKNQPARASFFVADGVHTSFLDIKTPWSAKGP